MIMNQPDLLKEDSGEYPSMHQGMMDAKNEDTFFVPKDAISEIDCQAGDTLRFSVLGKDEDGDIEVKLAGYDKGNENSDDYYEDLKRTFQKDPSNSMG